MASTTATTQPAPTLLFIPDISGFTQFVNDTEINHARHIIEELLNLLIESNQVGLEVSEIEGDAILFCKVGSPPSAKDLMEQVKKMFTEFHFHLQKYDSHRICDCSACKSANSLTLKFILHYGDVAINQIQQHKKLFGIDVITVHRLLKNDIDNREYALFTNNLTDGIADWKEISIGNNLQAASQVYDSGQVNYSFLTLENLYQDIPPLQDDDFKLKGHTASVLKTEAIIEAPLEFVFDIVTDVSWRGKWIPGTLPETRDINHYIAQNGQSHRCIANGPLMLAHDFKVQKDKIFFTETDQAKTYSCVYSLTRLEGGRSKLTSEFFIQKNFFKELMFKLMMKKKYWMACTQAWKNLNDYCKELKTKNTHHPYNIVLGEATMEMSPA